jgi:hypothetical protein
MSVCMSVKRTAKLPRFPLEGNLDLTYRCNNICAYWLWLPQNVSEQRQELSFDVS